MKDEAKTKMKDNILEKKPKREHIKDKMQKIKSNKNRVKLEEIVLTISTKLRVGKAQKKIMKNKKSRTNFRIK